MAKKPTPLTENDDLSPIGNEADLDQAIDDLRGVLKADATGEAPAFDAEFGGGSSDFDLDASFGGGLDDTPAFGAAETGASDFGGSDFGGSDFGGGASFGGSDFGSSDFGGSSAAASSAPGSALNANLDLIMDIPINLEIVLGTSRMQVSGLMNLEEGATIALDKKIGEPVEITVNGRRIAKGEITVLEHDDTRFGVKLTEVLSTKTT
ncbi:flagellar motor switch protein FliN [Rhizobiales bacterium RZME27]|uniref:Flagellar motor switch protein FliN n=1 Tax=Endobacterium cereale TaxID=2663029 RepID=A0A6A8AE58_9HYPH|nr:flagellar motor switch protein FliN [Endobacterium cereale]MEB2848250.1 flagellar motor switch protein FliN [Endobacterium cereale]MQY48107.1 flagellar motor switch protein FliN [Endobacterium cereale]